MTTLRDLQYMIEANTNGLNKAFPALDKLANTLERLDKTVKTLETSFDKGMISVGKTAAGAGNAVNKSAEQIKSANKRIEASLIGAKLRMDALNKSVKDAGASSRLLANNARAYNVLERALKKSGVTAGEAALAKAKFTAALTRGKTELQSFNQSLAATSSVQKQSESALLRQENAVERVRQKVLDLKNTLEGQGARTERIDALTSAFAEFEAKMTSGALAARDASQATNKLNAEIGRIKRNEDITTMEAKMRDLASSAQVALGPLSGVASRITAITSLAHRNNIVIAGVIGGFIALTTAMAKAIVLGANYEQQMHKIQSILKVTGNRIGMTAAEVDTIAKRVGETTMATQGMARNAAATLLVVRGVSKEIFESALLAAQGLAVLTEGNIESQIRRFARILEDPAANIEALAESGVVFNAVEKERIQLLQLSGKMDEARAAVMKRLEVVMEAAKSETQGLTGAWHELTESFTSFMQSTATSGGVLGTLAAILRDVNSSLKNLNNNYAIAEKLAWTYNNVIKVLGTALVLLVENIDKVIAYFVILSAMKVATMIFGIYKAVSLLNKGLKSTALLAMTASGGLKGLAAGIIAIAGLEAYEYFNDTGDAAGDAAGKILELETSIAKLKGSEQHVERLHKAMAKAGAKISDALVTGETPDIDMAAVQQAIDLVNAGKIKEAADHMDRFFTTSEKGSRLVRQLSDDLHEAAQQWVLLKNQFMPLLTENEKMNAQLTNLETNWEKMSKVLQESGMSAEQAEATLRRLRTEIELNGSSVNQFVNNMEKSIEMQKRELAMTSAVGGELRTLQTEQKVLEQLWASGIVTSANYQEALEDLRKMGLGPMADEIERATRGLDALQHQTAVAAMQKGLNDNLELMQAEVDFAGAADRERAIGIELIRQKQVMLNAGIEENTQAWNDQLDVIRQIAELDFTSQHIKAMEAMRGEALAQDAILKTMFYSESTRNRMIDLAQKEYELSRKYGSLLDERAQKELAVFKVLQERDKLLEQWKNVADVVDNSFQSLEDSIVSAAQTGVFEWKKLASAILSDILRMNVRAILKPIQDKVGSMMGNLLGFPAAASAGGLFGELGTVGNPAYVKIVGAGGLFGGNGENTFGAPLEDVIRKPLDGVGGDYIQKRITDAFGGPAKDIQTRIDDAFSLDGASYKPTLDHLLPTEQIAKPIEEAAKKVARLPAVTENISKSITTSGTKLAEVLTTTTETTDRLPIPSVKGDRLTKSIEDRINDAFKDVKIPEVSVPAIDTSILTKSVTERAAGAVDQASAMLGFTEKLNTNQLNSFMKMNGVDINAASTAWCSGFVNANLESMGIKGTDSLVANSFKNWGVGVNPADVLKGDVLLKSNGLPANALGGHVGMATGLSKMQDGELFLEMISGNTTGTGLGKGGVGLDWLKASELDVRRAAEAFDFSSTGGINLPEKFGPPMPMDYNLSKFAGGRLSDNVMDLRGGWAGNPMGMAQQTFSANTANVSSAMFGQTTPLPSVQPMLSGMDSMGGTGGLGGMPSALTSTNLLGGEGLTSFSESLTKATESVTGLGDGLTDTVGKLTSSFDTVSTATDQLATSSLPKVTSGLDTLATDTVAKSVQSQAVAAAQTAQMGTTTAITSAQVQQLGTSASVASAQVSAGGGGGGGGIIGSIKSLFGFADGAAFSNAGIVSTPTAFSFGNGKLGQMGEVGPEAVMPLVRGSNGKLGVSNNGGGGGGGKDRFKIVNVLDPRVIGDYLNTDEGEELIVNAIRRNKDLVN